MPNAWIEALKEYNASKGSWCLPKKGSKEYKEVMAIVARKKAGKQTKEEPAKAKEEPAKKKETSEDRVEKRAKVRAFLEKAILKRREKKAKERLLAEAKASRERIMAKVAAYKAKKGKAEEEGTAKKIEQLERKVASYIVRGMVIDAAGYRKATEELEETKEAFKALGNWFYKYEESYPIKKFRLSDDKLYVEAVVVVTNDVVYNQMKLLHEKTLIYDSPVYKIIARISKSKPQVKVQITGKSFLGVPETVDKLRKTLNSFGMELMRDEGKEILIS